MNVTNIEQLYQKYIEPIPVDEQLRLISLITQKLALHSKQSKHKQRSLLELEGLGAEIWQDIDAQEYVNRLRDEWETDHG